MPASTSSGRSRVSRTVLDAGATAAKVPAEVCADGPPYEAAIGGAALGWSNFEPW